MITLNIIIIIGYSPEVKQSVAGGPIIFGGMRVRPESYRCIGNGGYIAVMAS
jgi:hypothetical protein